MDPRDTQSQTDLRWMRQALEISRRGLGGVEPNPKVGAVVADGEQFISEGWHQRFGGPHAEVMALEAAGERARGATIYVTLEPCCHHGKTPPCSDRVLASGVRRVVVAMCDPFGKVCGQGIAMLQAAGLEVVLGVLEDEARLLNQPFIKYVTTSRPYVTAKWAMTLDGRLASSTGDSRWISGPASRQWVHSLRSRMDAIIVGAGTALADDPMLNVRLAPQAAEAEAAYPDYGRRPLRVVLDEGLELSPQSKLVGSAREIPLLLVTVDESLLASDAAQALRAAGAEIIALPASASRISIDGLLAELGRRGLTNVLVEGGRATLDSFFAAEVIDSLAVFIAPKLIGGEPCHVAPGPLGLSQMSSALSIINPAYSPIGDDLLVTGLLRQY